MTDDERKKKQREYRRRYYLKNIEKMREKGRAYAAKNAEQHRANARRWNKENKERYTENLKRWRRENKERHYQLTRKYHTSPLGKAALSRASAKRRARLKIDATLTAAEWADIVLFYDSSCAYCFKKNIKLTQDHVIPVSKGGHHTKENVVPACRSCNSRKRTKLMRPSKEYRPSHL